MTNLARKIFRGLGRDQRGITGLETAIVLIAFVVVSSVFAFAALSTGLFTTDKAKSTIHAGLAETQGTMELKGSITVTSAVSGSAGTVSDVAFWVANAAGGQNTDLTPGNTIIKYTGGVGHHGTQGFNNRHRGNQDDKPGAQIFQGLGSRPARYHRS